MGLSATRNPSVHRAEGRVCLKLDAAVEEELWNRLRDRYREETGFDLQRE